MATLQQIRDKANAKLATFWNELQSRQATYHSKHGKYFQLLAGSDLTLNATDTPFSVISPSDEAYSVDIDYAWTDTVPFKIEVREWVAPDGPGYKAIVTINHDGTIYERQRDNNNVDTGWYLAPQYGT